MACSSTCSHSTLEEFLRGTLRFVVANCTFILDEAMTTFICCLKEQGLTPMLFTEYFSFLNYFTSNYEEEEYSHISWNSIPDKKTIYLHVSNQRENLMGEIELFVDPNDPCTTVQLEHFKKTLVKTNHGGEKKRLKQVSIEATLSYIVTFLQQVFPQILHHRNKLKPFRSVMKDFCSQFNAVYMDMDHSEKLIIPMKKHLSLCIGHTKCAASIRGYRNLEITRFTIPPSPATRSMTRSLPA